MKTFRLSLVVLLFLLVLSDLFFRVSGFPPGRGMSNDAYLSIMITALGVLIATAGIVVALAAFWGYVGVKDFVREMAIKEVAKAVTETIAQYPQPERMFAVLNKLEERAEILDQIQNQIATAVENKPVSPRTASNKMDGNGNGESRAPTPIEKPEGQVTPIEPYPGEGKGNGVGTGTTE